MARIPMRELFRFGHSFFSRPISFFPSKSPQSGYSRSPLYPPTHSLLYSIQDLTRFYQIQAFLITSGLLQTPIWADKVLKHSLDLAGIDYTVSIFRVLDNPDAFCVNAVIKGYSISSVPGQALVFYFQMLENGFVPNSYSFVPLIGSCAKMGCFESGGKCHGQAVKNGVDSVLTVQNSLIHMYGCCGKIGYAEKVFAEMPMRDVYSWNSILEAHVKIGDLVLARKVFDAMPERSVVSWNIMIGGYSKGGSPGNALKLFRTMAAMEGIRGNEATMASILSSCRRSARLKEGRSVHGFLIKNLGRKSNLVIDAALIDMYCKCHKVELARSSIFDKMGYRNVVCWNSMVLGHCIHGQPEDGLELFAEMVVVCPPDEITFVGVLCACARAGLVTEGTSYFDQMVNVFSIKPNFGHFWCMANLYASAGMVEEAEEVLRNNISQGLSLSQSLLWANLLTSCRFRGDVAIGERIAMSLIEKDPGNFSYYQFLLNIYDSAGRLEDANRVKKMMNGRIPGCNLVDLKEIVHDLRASKLLDTRHKQQVM